MWIGEELCIEGNQLHGSARTIRSVLLGFESLWKIYLFSINGLPVGLWPMVLSRMTRHDEVYLLHYFLCGTLEMLVSIDTD